MKQPKKYVFGNFWEYLNLFSKKVEIGSINRFPRTIERDLKEIE